jgi:hypothetical protein
MEKVMNKYQTDSSAGLPDGLFSNQKSRFGQIFDSL